MTKTRDDYREYQEQLQPSTTPLGIEPVTPMEVDWDAWERAKARLDAADAALLRFLRGEGS